MLPDNTPHLTPLSTPTPDGIAHNFMEREAGLFWHFFKTEIKFEQNIHVKKQFGYILWFQNYYILFYFYLASIASGKVFSIHKKLISGVTHAHNPGVFPQHLKDGGHFTACCTFYLGFFSFSENQNGTSLGSCISDNKCILHKGQAVQCVHPK